MKYAMLQNAKIIPGGMGAVIDRAGYLTAIFAVSVAELTGSPESAAVSLTVTHCDTEDGIFEPVMDKRLGLDNQLVNVPISVGDNLNFDLDLLGCKRFIKISAEYSFTGGSSPAATTAYALALGDKDTMPV